MRETADRSAVIDSSEAISVALPEISEPAKTAIERLSEKMESWVAHIDAHQRMFPDQ